MENKTAIWRKETSTCRYCDTTENCFKNISSLYIWNGSKEVYSEIISDTFNITVVSSDSSSISISHQICEHCIARLRDASDFKRSVHIAEEMLRNQLKSSQNFNKMLGISAVEILADCQVKEENDSFSGDDETPAHKDPRNDTAYIESSTSKIMKEVTIFEDSEPAKATQRKSTRIPAQTKNPSVKKSRKKETSAEVNAATQRKNNDNLADDVVRRNSIAILRHSTAYPFQPTKRSFRCCFCPYTPDGHDPIAFRRHMDTTHAGIDKSICLKHHNDSMRRVDITNLKCNDCDNICFDLEDMAKHLVKSHNCDIDLTQSVGLVPIKLESDRFACVICSKSYTTLHQLSRHSGTHFYRNICFICGNNFETLKGLNKHVIFAHSKHKFLCQKCKMPFPDLNSKKHHLRNSKKCRNFKCKLCKESFLCLETQQEHLVKTHGKEKITYPCPECGEVFEKRIRRYLHFKMAHTDDFKCSHCGTKFSNNRCLQDHIARVHTFERKYRCSVCDKAFIDARTLRTHTFIHDDSKKQQCPICNRAFTMKIRLKYHVQKYHPDILSEVFPTGPS